MSKRGKYESLTGGTGDVNPQILTVVATQTAANTTTVVQQPLPIPRYPTSKDRSLVMEFLWLDYYHTNPTLTAGVINTNLVTVTTNPTSFTTAAGALQDSRLIDAWWKNTIVAGAPGDRYDLLAEQTQDLTDKAGHGIIVASDNLYFGVYSQNTGVADSFVIKAAYRWKEVSLTEYIGIVQSQQ